MRWPRLTSCAKVKGESYDTPMILSSALVAGMPLEPFSALGWLFGSSELISL